MNDYVAESGDVTFAKQKWDRVWKAYQFLLSTYDAQGFPKTSASDTAGWRAVHCFR